MQLHRRLLLIQRVAQLHRRDGRELADLLFDLFGAFGGDPALRQEGALGHGKAPGGLLAALLLVEDFVEDFQPLDVPGKARKVFLHLIALGICLRNPFLEFLNVFRGRTVAQSGETFLRKIRLFQRRAGFLFDAAMDRGNDQRAVPRAAHNVKCRDLQRIERFPQLVRIAAGDAARQIDHLPAGSQRTIRRLPQAFPRFILLDARLRARLDTLQLAAPALEALHGFNGMPIVFFVRQHRCGPLLRNLLERAEQGLLRFVKLGKLRKRPFDALHLLPGFLRTRAVRLPIGCVFLLRRRNLDAVHLLQRPEEAIPIRFRGEQRQVLHFNDCHAA